MLRNKTVTVPELIMKNLIIFIIFLYASAAYSLCEDSKFAKDSSVSSNDHTAKLLVKEDAEFNSYFVQFDGDFDQLLTKVKKEDCGWGVFEPSGILEFFSISSEYSLFQFSWDYNPSGSAYADKYFCYMYLQFEEEAEVLYNSCENVIDDPGLPKGFTSYDIKNGKLTLTDENDLIVFEKGL
jgi:hypothetical protein|tara:strand:+ start:420 stop:965 length:546 start_codon:yes stop_codon:yes gene_type:complete